MHLFSNLLACREAMYAQYEGTAMSLTICCSFCLSRRPRWRDQLLFDLVRFNLPSVSTPVPFHRFLLTHTSHSERALHLMSFSEWLPGSLDSSLLLPSSLEMCDPAHSLAVTASCILGRPHHRAYQYPTMR